MHGWFRKPRYQHPCEENPTLWKLMRAKCWHQLGERCLYRSPALGIKCGRTWNDPVPWTPRDLLPWTHRQLTRMNADHIYPARLYPKRRWDESNLQPLCEWHNKRKGIRGHIDYRPGHYHRVTQVLKWWLCSPFYLLRWIFN